MRGSMLFLLLLFAGVSNASEQRSSTSPCPGLVSSYATDKFEQLLVVTDSEFSSVEDCEQLGQFFFEESRHHRYSLDFSGLAAIVSDSWQPVNEEAPFLLVDAVLSWLQKLGYEQYAEYFKNFVNDYLPAEENVQLFFTLVIWAILITVVVLVGYELYRAGLLRLPHRTHAEKHQPAQASTETPWDLIVAMPLRQQIAALLKFSIGRLAASKLIPSSLSLTNHELASCLEQSDNGKASLLREQIEQTEPVVYGDEPVSERRLQRCQAIARRIGDA